jgi:hypothetical protein
VFHVVCQPSARRTTRLSDVSTFRFLAGSGLATSQMGTGCCTGLGSTVTFSNLLYSPS